MEYKLLEQRWASDLVVAVNRHLADGWEPQGGVVYSRNCWAQAMVRRESPSAQAQPEVQPPEGYSVRPHMVPEWGWVWEGPGHVFPTECLPFTTRDQAVAAAWEHHNAQAKPGPEDRSKAPPGYFTAQVGGAWSFETSSGPTVGRVARYASEAEATAAAWQHHAERQAVKEDRTKAPPGYSVYVASPGRGGRWRVEYPPAVATRLLPQWHMFDTDKEAIAAAWADHDQQQGKTP